MQRRAPALNVPVSRVYWIGFFFLLIFNGLNSYYLLYPAAASPPILGQRALRFTDASSTVASADVPSTRTDEDALGQYLDLYLARSMDTTRAALTARVGAYTVDQIHWLRQQKADAKSPDVLLPFASFPTFAAQVQEMCNEKVRSR